MYSKGRTLLRAVSAQNILHWILSVNAICLAEGNREKLRSYPLFSKQQINKYSGTPPYDHPVYKTTSLLRPYSFKPNVKTIESFYYFEDPVNATTSLLRPGFYGPTVVALTGLHCKQVSTRSISKSFSPVHSKLPKQWKYDDVPYRQSMRYDVWHHRIRKTPFSSVYIIRPLQKNTTLKGLAKTDG